MNIRISNVLGVELSSIHHHEIKHNDTVHELARGKTTSMLGGCVKGRLRGIRDLKDIMLVIRGQRNGATKSQEQIAERMHLTGAVESVKKMNALERHENILHGVRRFLSEMIMFVRSVVMGIGMELEHIYTLTISNHLHCMLRNDSILRMAGLSVRNVIVRQQLTV